jgi:hypothetical protein
MATTEKSACVAFDLYSVADIAAITFLLLLYVLSPAGSVGWWYFGGCLRLSGTEIAWSSVASANECKLLCLVRENCCSVMLYLLPTDLGKPTCVLDSISKDDLWADATTLAFPCDIMMADYYAHTGKPFYRYIKSLPHVAQYQYSV